MRKYEKEHKDIADAIHYPMCWDTMAYPTIVTALWEMVALPKGHKCVTCGKPQRIVEWSE